MPSYVAFLQQITPLKKAVHVFDESIAPNEVPPGSIQIGGFNYPGRDGRPIVHHVQDLLNPFGISDIYNVDIFCTHYEQAVYYDLPESLTVAMGNHPVHIPVYVFPQSSQSKPVFHSQNSHIATVDKMGFVTPVQPGTTRITVVASDNPILHYEVMVTVEPATTYVEADTETL